MVRFNYKQYLASREWAVRRERVRHRADGLCERCQLLPMVAVHHVTYEHIGNEPLEDLQAVWEPCHLYQSGKIAVDTLDVGSWTFSTGFSLFGADGPFEVGDRLAECGRWEKKYGPGWEEQFLAFVLSWPDITNLIPLNERPVD